MSDNKYKIPKIIHQTFMNSRLPNEIIKVIQNNKKICPDCKFLFYNDKDCDDFIKNNFSEQIYNAFNKINKVYGAMKADFFRYCVLYKLGGVYLDIKSLIKYPIFKIIKKDDLCLLDTPRNNLEPWRTNKPTYEQWLLMFCPNHPYLNEMILKMVHYIETKYVPTIPNYPVLNSKEKILHVTGPDAFTEVVNEYILKNNIIHRCIDYSKYFERIGCVNYTIIYSINGKKHYSGYNEPLYIE